MHGTPTAKPTRLCSVGVPSCVCVCACVCVPVLSSQVVTFLKTLGIADDFLAQRVLCAWPDVLARDVETQLRPVVLFLMRLGIEVMGWVAQGRCVCVCVCALVCGRVGHLSSHAISIRVKAVTCVALWVLTTDVCAYICVCVCVCRYQTQPRSSVRGPRCCYVTSASPFSPGLTT